MSDAHLSRRERLRLTLARTRLRIMAGFPLSAVPPAVPARLMGLSLHNPLGLAAGFDKTGRLVKGAGSAGFGFVEVGSVTPETVAVAKKHLECRQRSGTGPVVGVNLCCRRGADAEAAMAQYLAVTRACLPCADYLAINYGSPAARQGRQAGEDWARALLGGAALERERHARDTGAAPPLAIKLRLARKDAIDVLRIARDAAFAGAILAAPPDWTEADTLGRLAAMREAVPGMSLVAVGGISDARQIRARLDLGFDGVQILSAVIEKGAGFPRSILAELARQTPFGSMVAGVPA